MGVYMYDVPYKTAGDTKHCNLVCLGILLRRSCVVSGACKHKIAEHAARSGAQNRAAQERHAWDAG